MVYSLLDNDLYKFTMAQCVLHNFPNVQVEYDLSIRSKGVDLRPLREEIEREIRQLASLMLAPEEERYLNTIRYLSGDYIEWLKGYKFNPEKHVRVLEKDNNLAITISGNWLQTILYEVPILAIISEIYHNQDGSMHLAECMEKLNQKVELIEGYGDGFKFAEFGTRRRNSYLIQDHVVGYLVKTVPKNIVGTSNVHFAMKYGIKPIGTIAHEMMQCSQVLFPLKSHQKDIMDVWNKEFDGDVGIMLSDTLGTDAFLRDFTYKFAKSFDGVRQDSGDPFEIGYKIVNHYKSFGIDPKTKTIIFSDSLDIPKAIGLYNEFKDKIKVSFGIGTNLTNDCGDVPLSIVIKVQECNGFPVAKISDTPEKAMCRNVAYLDYLKSIFLT